MVVDCPLEDYHMMSIGRLSQLTQLTLVNTSVTNHGVFALCELKELTELQFGTTEPYLGENNKLDHEALAGVIIALPKLVTLELPLPNATTLCLGNSSQSHSQREDQCFKAQPNTYQCSFPQRTQYS